MNFEYSDNWTDGFETVEIARESKQHDDEPTEPGVVYARAGKWDGVDDADIVAACAEEK